MKRVKKNLALMRKENTCDKQPVNEKFEVPVKSLLSENELFEQIQEELFDSIVKQTNLVEQNYAEKFDRMNKINIELRKSCMQELQVLRETYFLKSTGKLSQNDAKMFENTHIFNVDLGLDQGICDLLN